MLFARRHARPVVASDTIPRTAGLRGRSRRKIARLHSRKGIWIATQLLLRFVQQLAEFWSLSFVLSDPLPLRVAGQFGK